MANLTRTQLKAFIAARITDPLNQQITPAVMRNVLGKVIDDLFNLADDNDLLAFNFWGALKRSTTDPQTIEGFVDNLFAELEASTRALLDEKADLVNGKVPAAQLPSYVDDILEFDTVADLPAVGERGKLYVITTGVDDGKQYRWAGTVYAKIGDSGLDAHQLDNINALDDLRSRVSETTADDKAVPFSYIDQELAAIVNELHTFQGQFQGGAVLYQYNQPPRTFSSLQAALDAASPFYQSCIFLHANSPKATVAKSCVIYAGSCKIGGLTVQNNAECHVYGEIMSYDTTAVNVNTGILRHIGDLTHTSNTTGAASVVLYPSGKYYGRGTLTLTSTNGSAIGLIASGLTEIDFEGTILVTNKGKIARGSNKFRLAGNAISFDQGLELFRGQCNVFATIDVRKGTGPAITSTQVPNVPDEYHYLHAGCNVLSPVGQPSIANGNPPAGLPTVYAAGSVCYSVLPDPALVTVYPLGVLPSSGAGGGPGFDPTSILDSIADIEAVIADASAQDKAAPYSYVDNLFGSGNPGNGPGLTFPLPALRAQVVALQYDVDGFNIDPVPAGSAPCLPFADRVTRAMYAFSTDLNGVNVWVKIQIG